MNETQRTTFEKAPLRAPNLRLKKRRFEAGLTQRHLAALAGLNPGVVQLAEKGWTPHPGHARAILDVLEAKLDEPVRYIDLWPLPGEARR